jgi:glycosyltransferase involved in cell wall biosynthesis
VVIPAYNEATHIGEVIDRIRQAVPGAAIVVVDDGSSDDTVQATEASGTRVLAHPYNKGNGAAVKTALRSLETDKLVIIDGDGQHPPETIPILLGRLEHYDLVVGARTSESESPIHRNLGNWLLRQFATYLSDCYIPDLTSGFRAVDRLKALEFIHLYPNGFSFPTTNTMAFISAGYSVFFEPIVAQTRSKDSNSKIHPIRDGLRFGLMILRISTMINPLRVFLPVGFFSLLTGIAWGIHTFILSRQLSVAGTLLISVGLNILFFGIVVDQLVAMRLRGRD